VSRLRRFCAGAYTDSGADQHRTSDQYTGTTETPLRRHLQLPRRWLLSNQLAHTIHPPPPMPTATIPLDEQIKIYYMYLDDRGQYGCNEAIRWVAIGRSTRMTCQPTLNWRSTAC